MQKLSQIPQYRQSEGLEEFFINFQGPFFCPHSAHKCQEDQQKTLSSKKF